MILSECDFDFFVHFWTKITQKCLSKPAETFISRCVGTYAVRVIGSIGFHKFCQMLRFYLPRKLVRIFALFKKYH